MSEETTLDEFVKKSGKLPIDSISDSSVGSSLDETSVGEIPEDWKTTRLADIAKETEYGLTESAEPYDTNKPRYIRTQDFDDFGGLKEDSRASLSQEKAKDGLLEDGDILFARSGSVGASLGKTYLYDTDHGECCFGGYSIRHRLQNKGLNHCYLSQYTLSEQYWDWVRRRAKTTAQSNINTSEYGSLLLPIPSLEEQRKIATVLHNVDQAIQKTEEIIEQINRLKSGVIQQAFEKGIEQHDSYIEAKSGKIPEDWELVRFESVIDETRYGTDNKSNTDEDGYPTLRIPNIVEKRVTLEDLKHTPIGKDELDRLKLEEDDILVIRTNGNPDYVGRCAIFSEHDEPFVFASYLIRVRVDESRVRPKYVREFLNSRRGRSEMDGWIRSSAGNYNLSVGGMEKFQIPIPELSEQDKIVEKIEAVEQTIQANQQYRNHLQHFKQGLMQDLLSGKVRTTDSTISVPDEVRRHG